MPWKTHSSHLEASFKFTSFEEAIDFMVQVSKVCTQLNHHPDWSNKYNKVHITLQTHDAGNIVTDKDHTLSKEIDKIYARFHIH